MLSVSCISLSFMSWTERKMCMGLVYWITGTCLNNVEYDAAITFQANNSRVNLVQSDLCCVCVCFENTEIDFCFSFGTRFCFILRAGVAWECLWRCQKKKWFYWTLFLYSFSKNYIFLHCCWQTEQTNGMMWK